jgi:hypothetical protein
MRRALSLFVLVGALLPATAEAGDLWATVNVCDTTRHPNTIGIRASMPGQPRPARLWMRYRVQYDAGGGSWRYVANADSGWRRAGRARPRPAESGWSFEFEPPAGPVTFRGVVRFQWRRAGAVVRRALRVTERGHRSTAGADPAGYSAATCSMA